MKSPETIPISMRHIVNPTPYGEDPRMRALRISSIVNLAKADRLEGQEATAGLLSRAFDQALTLPGAKAIAGLALVASLAGCADTTTDTTPPLTSPTTITTEVPPTTTTEAPTTTISTTAPETVPTTEPCPIIESSRKNFYGEIPAGLGNIHTYVESNNSFSYSLLNGSALGWDSVDVENYGDTEETHSVTYVELGFGNSGEGEDCRIVSAKIAVGANDIPYSALVLRKFDKTRDFKSSQFVGRTEGINQELIEYIEDMQQRGLEIGISLVTKSPNGIIFPWCNNISIDDQFYGTCIYNAEQNRSIDRNNDLINALQEFEDTGIFPFDTLDPNAIYYGYEFYRLDHSNS